MTTKPLRPYQTRTLEAIDAAFEAGKRTVAAVGPTGAGKSRIAKACVEKASNALIISHTRGLKSQLADTVGCTSCTIQELLAVHKTDPGALAAVAKEYDLAVLDECHHYSGSAEWELVHSLFAHARLIGFTATPERGDGKPLAGHYEEMVKIADYSELVAAGYLVPSTVVHPDPALLCKQTKRIHKASRVDVTDAYREHCAGLRTLIFCENRPVAREVVKALTESDVKAVLIDGETPDGVRDAAFEAFQRGDLTVLVNVDVLTEGIDLPCTEAIILSQSCISAGAYLQIAGRGLRASPGKSELLFVDLTGASLEFGAPHIDRQYSLTGKAISATGGNSCVCATCWRAFGFRGEAPEEDQPSTDAPTEGLNLHRTVLGAEQLESAKAAVVARQARRSADWRLTAKERKERAKRDQKWLDKFELSLGLAVWVCEPTEDEAGNEVPVPCPHCAAERPRGKNKAAGALLAAEPSEREPEPAVAIPARSRAERIVELCRELRRNVDRARQDLSRAFTVWAERYPDELPLSVQEFDEALPHDLKQAQANLVSDLVAKGTWARGMWRPKYYAILPSKNRPRR